ncbi:MAG: NAD-binding protein [Promethearchaeota archaeon]
MDNYRGKEDSYVEVEHKACAATEVQVILGVDEFLGKGVYKKVNSLSDFEGKRTLILDSGDDSLELALELTKHTGRVIVVTSSKSIPGSEELKKRLKSSDVKMLHQSELLEIQGTDEVEKVVINDFDEQEKYELFVDSVIMLEE